MLVLRQSSNNRTDFTSPCPCRKYFREPTLQRNSLLRNFQVGPLVYASDHHRSSFSSLSSIDPINPPLPPTLAD